MQALLKEEEPRAVYVHCTAHRLNLAVQDCMDGVRPLRDAVQETARVIGFFRDSPKRLCCLASFGAKSSLRPLCPTRWTCSEPALASLVRNYVAVLDTLEAIAEDASSRPDVASTASGHARRMQSFDFFFGVCLALHLLRMTTPVMKSVQGQQQTLATNLQLVAALRSSVLGQRSRFEDFYAATVKKAEELGVSGPVQKRVARPPRRLDDGGEPYRPQTPEEQFRPLYFQAIDRLSSALGERYGGGQEGAAVTDEQRLARAESALLTADKEDVKATAAFYRLDEARLGLHCQMLQDVCRQDGVPLLSLADAAGALRQPRLSQLLPECVGLLQLILTAPATSCTAERSFSQLRRLKTWLRSNMTQARLNHAAICAVYPEELHALDRAALMREFATRSAQRVNVFGWQ